MSWSLDQPLTQDRTHQFLTSGMSRALRVLPDLKLKGRGAHSKAMPLAVLSV